MTIDLILFIKGVITGIAIAAPIGPVAALCIQRTLADGKIAGLISGFGAAAADALCGFVVAYGFTFVSELVMKHGNSLRITSGIALCIIGVKIFLSKPALQKENLSGDGGIFGRFISAFVIVIANPITLISFAVIFAGLGVIDDEISAPPMILIAGVFAGSAFLWFALCSVTFLFRDRFDGGKFLWLNRVAGAVISLFGVIALTRPIAF